MEQWTRKFRKSIQDAGMTVHMLCKYVDDVLTIVNTLERGARWQEDGTISYNLKDILDDIRSGRSRHEITLEVLKEAANATTPYLRLTGEVALDRTGIPV